MTHPLVKRVRDAHTAVLTALSVEQQAIRDAYAAGVSITTITRQGLGTLNRQRVYAILGRAPDGTTPQPPEPTPVVYLRGAGRSDQAWEHMEQAMWARGWMTVRHRETAWHAARAGIPTVMVDFSTDQAPTEVVGGAVTYGYGTYVTVSPVRARYVNKNEREDHELQVVAPVVHQVKQIDAGVCAAVAVLVASALCPPGEWQWEDGRTQLPSTDTPQA